jgi:hypothetical protein
MKKYDYVMFEREITSGNHISYHFAYKNRFSTISDPRSTLYPLEKHLEDSIKVNLFGYTMGITPQNTTWKEDPVFHIGGLGQELDPMLKDYFHIVPKFPVFYFTKSLKSVLLVSPHKCGFHWDSLLDLRHPQEDHALAIANCFYDEANDIIFACHFDEKGNVIGDEINIEIMPQYNMWDIVKQKLIYHFFIDPLKVAVYDNMFQYYRPEQFHWHFKVKLRSDGTTIKFYRTLPHNPYL